MKLFTHFKFMIRYIALYLLMFTCFSLSAVEVNDLYVAKVEVTTQLLTERNQALKKAMSAVILKVGGDKEVLRSPVIKSALRRYKNYYSQFHYTTENGATSVVVTFNEDKVNQLFIDAELPLWGSLRPQILVWLVEENGLRREIIASSSVSDLPLLINQFSINRGLPLIMPLMDLTDVKNIEVSDIWGRFLTPVREYSSRYMSDMSVVIRLSNSSLVEESDCNSDCSSNYTLDWSLLSDGLILDSKSLAFHYKGNVKHDLLNQALEDLTQSIYQRYALSGDNDNSYIIDVANIETMNDYVEISSFIEQLSAVKQAKLIGAKGNNRRFELELMGSKPAFLASLKLNKQLKHYVAPLAAVNKSEIPVFIWNNK